MASCLPDRFDPQAIRRDFLARVRVHAR